MPGVLDSFVVELGLDPAKFVRGQNQALDDYKRAQQEFKKRFQDMEDRAQSAGDFFGKLRGQVIALYAAFTAGRGMREFVQDTISTTANLGRMSRTMDISAQELASWRGAAGAMGGSADEMSSSIYGLEQSLQQFTLTGESAVIPYFRALGIGLNDSNGKLKTSTQLLLEANERVQGMDPARATALLTALGASQSMINFLLQKPSQVRAQLAAQRLTAPSPADIKAAQDFQRAWNDVERESSKAGRTLLTALAPAILAVLKYVNVFVTYLATHKAAAVAFFGALTAAVGLLSVGLLASGITASITAITTAVSLLGAALLATPVGWLLGGIALIAGAGYLIYSNWGALKKWWHDLWGGMGRDTESAAARIKRTSDELSGRRPAVGGAQRSPAVTPRSGLAGLMDRIGIATPPGTPAAGSSRSAPADSEAWRAAQESERKYGVPADVTYAQWALESGHGRHVPAGSNNPFGIKAGRGQTGVEAGTSEFVNGRYVQTTGRFRRFGSVQEAFDAHAKLLATDSRYASAMAKRGDSSAFADALTGVYATDPNYGTKLRSIMKSHAQMASRSVASYRSSYDNRRTSSSETNIGGVTVVTQASDARGIARDMSKAIREHSFAAQANYGPV